MTVDELFRNYVESVLKCSIDNAVRDAISNNIETVVMDVIRKQEVTDYIDALAKDKAIEVMEERWGVSEDQIRDVVRNMSFSVDISADIEVD